MEQFLINESFRQIDDAWDKCIGCCVETPILTAMTTIKMDHLNLTGIDIVHFGVDESNRCQGDAPGRRGKQD